MILGSVGLVRLRASLSSTSLVASIGKFGRIDLECAVRLFLKCKASIWIVPEMQVLVEMFNGKPMYSHHSFRYQSNTSQEARESIHIGEQKDL